MTTIPSPTAEREVAGVYGERLTRGAAPAPPRSRFLRLSAWAFFFLIAASWLFVLSEQNARYVSLLSAETWEHAQRFFSRFLGLNSGATPAFLQPERWAEAVGFAYSTLAMSVLAISLAAIGMLLTVVPAARTAADGTLTLSRSVTGRVAFVVLRGAYIFSRSVPELVWAMLIVFILAPGILPGALALGLHNFGILGKLCAEVVEDLDLRPARAMRAAGASTPQMLLYGVLPSVLPQFLMYIFYRWEVIIRTTIVVGFVSAAGLGREFKLRMSFFHYTDVALLLLVYILLVFAVDLVSMGLRRMAR